MLVVYPADSKMNERLTVFITAILVSYSGEGEAYCTNLTNTINIFFSTLGEGKNLSCDIPRSCAKGIWLHTNTTSWYTDTRNINAEGLAISNAYYDDKIENVLQIANISTEQTGTYSCICQPKLGSYEEVSCYHLKFGQSCDLRVRHADVWKVSLLFVQVSGGSIFIT